MLAASGGHLYDTLFTVSQHTKYIYCTKYVKVQGLVGTLSASKFHEWQSLAYTDGDVCFDLVISYRGAFPSNNRLETEDGSTPDKKKSECRPSG